MNKKLIQTFVAGALLAGACSLRAQEPPPGPPPDLAGPGPGGPMGPRMELLGFAEMHPGKVVSGAPYSATAITETTQKLADGNTIDRKVQSTIYRDSQGRTRRETTFTGAGPLSTSGQPKSIVMIHDPVASTAYVLHPDTKDAEQLPTHPKGAKKSGNVQGKFEAHLQEEVANGTLKKEDLGTQSINGIQAQGTRYTRTIPAGQVGNANPISIVNEQWYSSDLQVIVKSTRTDPRFGQTTYALTNIQRNEPAASLFAVPSDYNVTQAKMRPRMHRGGPGGPGAGAPPDGVTPPPPPAE
ncbi:MAG TPA: hypothetical protein VMJ35_12675 [Dongiaceae bacterium]|nr:hypothetical protein [Dongiaceae bacterium]